MPRKDVDHSTTSTLWYLFIDMVGSSRIDLPVNRQLEKVKSLNFLIRDSLSNIGQPLHISYTGDGVLFTFEEKNITFPFDLSKDIHKKINLHNENIKNNELKICYRIGIGYGDAILYNNFLGNSNIPWAYDLVFARRIMDKANLNQILLTPAAYLKLQAHPNPDIRDKYFINIKEVGKIFPKNGGEMTVYSFYQKDNNGNYVFGNDHDVSSSPEETKRNGITQFCNVNDISDNSIHIFSKFIQEDEVFHIEEYLKIFKRKGLELDLISSDILFKTLFEYSYDYISATHLIPSKHRYFHDQFQRTDFYDYQGEAIKKMHRKGKTEFYRFLMIDMDELETDFKNNMVRFRQFIDWHAQVGIRLLQIDRETACRIINNVFGPINVEIGVGLWHDGFAIHFGPINEYINPKDQSVKLTRRTFWLYDKSNEMYPKSKKFFEELLDLYKKGGCRDMKDFPM